MTMLIDLLGSFDVTFIVKNKTHSLWGWAQKVS